MSIQYYQLTLSHLANGDLRVMAPIENGFSIHNYTVSVTVSKPYIMITPVEDSEQFLYYKIISPYSFISYVQYGLKDHQIFCLNNKSYYGKKESRINLTDLDSGLPDQVQDVVKRHITAKYL